MLVNVDRVYSYIQSKDFEKFFEKLSRTLSRCVCLQKNERQQRKSVIDGLRNKEKNKKFRIKSEEIKSVVSRIEYSILEMTDFFSIRMV